MDWNKLIKGQISNTIHTLFIISLMAVLLCGTGWMIAGTTGAAYAAGLLFLSVILMPKVSIPVFMKASRARRLHPLESPVLFDMVKILSKRAGLKKAPQIYYLPGRKLNAFAIGTKENSAVCISEGMLSLFNLEQLSGIMAHEIAHIRNNDMKVMGYAAIFGRITYYASLFGQVMLILSLPLVFMGNVDISLTYPLLLALVPGFSWLLIMWLSRSREYQADLESARLTGRPLALASALERLEAFQKRWFPRRYWELNRSALPILKTHPPTEERIRRLVSLATPVKGKTGLRYPGTAFWRFS